MSVPLISALATTVSRPLKNGGGSELFTVIAEMYPTISNA